MTGTEPNPGGHPSPALVHRLPDNLALKPQVSSTIPTEGTFILGNSVEMAFSAAVADGATPGTICGVAVRITAFQPLTTSVPNVIPLCGGQNIPYNVPGGWGPSSDCVTSGFGPGGGPAGGGSVTFTTAAVGTVASAPFGAFDFSTRVSYPFTPTSAPVKVPYTVAQAYGNYALLLTIQVAEAGDYTFDIGIWQDSSAPHFFNQTVSTSILTGRALHEWGGGFCKSPDMQQQLPPPTDPPTKVICPGPVPSR